MDALVVSQERMNFLSAPCRWDHPWHTKPTLTDAVETVCTDLQRLKRHEEAVTVRRQLITLHEAQKPKPSSLFHYALHCKDADDALKALQADLLLLERDGDALLVRQERVAVLREALPVINENNKAGLPNRAELYALAVPVLKGIYDGLLHQSRDDDTLLASIPADHLAILQ